MLLDELYRLAMHDSYPRPRDLGILAREYAGLEIEKDDSYRLRYAEIIDRPWDDIELEFFQYAVKDAIATWRVHAVLRQKAVDCARRCGVRDETMRRWGVLTESIQIRGALALAQLTRNGLHLDLNRSTSVRRAVQEKIEKHVARIRQHPRSRGLFKIDPQSGEPRITKSQAPSLSNKVLQEILTEVAAEIEHDTGLPLEIPRTEKNQVSTPAKEWADYASLHSFVADWVEMTETFTLARFLGGLTEEIVHPRYATLVRSGRTSCSSPNIQQLPRKGGFRAVFVPTRGHFLLTVDYSFIEPRTLAAICEARYEKSTLADVIRAGRDPHAYSAALLLNQDPDEFLSLQQTDPGKFKSQRQAAKALNFGIPGGLGAASLVSLARRTYGVEMSLEEAEKFREKMIGEVYPEWSAYLAEDSMAILAQNLEASVDRCWQILDWQGTRSPSLVWAIHRVVRGETVRKDGKPYNSRFVNGIWRGLQQVNRSEILTPLISRRQGSVELERMLFHAGIVTLTGRVRGRVAFAQARNTPFQGLAADGAKLALWRLNREGFRVVGFVHDEFLIELPDEGGFVTEEKVLRVKEILCSEMENVLGGGLPVACEATLSTCWSKDARLIVRDGKVFPWCPGRENLDV